MTNDQVPFGRLRQVLLDLGFVEAAVPGPYLLFEHAPSGTLLPYREYQPGDNVTWADLVMTRRLLDERGLLDADALEAVLHKTPV
jgi:hypothetical protein